MGEGFPGPPGSGVGDQCRGCVGKSGFAAEDGFRGPGHADHGSAPLVEQAHLGGSFVPRSRRADIGPGVVNGQVVLRGGGQKALAHGGTVRICEVCVDDLRVEERAGAGGHPQVEQVVGDQQVARTQCGMKSADGGGGDYRARAKVQEGSRVGVVCDSVRGGAVPRAVAGEEDNPHPAERSFDKMGDSPRSRDGTLRT
jgi:hypothetical protein